MKGLHFDLCGGREHINLLYKPSKIHVTEEPGERPYLMYVEDVSKSFRWFYNYIYTGLMTRVNNNSNDITFILAEAYLKCLLVSHQSLHFSGNGFSGSMYTSVGLIFW